MTWKLTVVFSTRPFLRNTIDLESATSIILEKVEDDLSVIQFPAATDPRPHPSHNPPRSPVAPSRHSGYVNRDLKPTGSMPTFDKPKSDGVVTQDEIDYADLEGYTAYLEGTALDGKSPYQPQDGVLAKAWQNGFARAEHSDDRDDGEGL